VVDADEVTIIQRSAPKPSPGAVKRGPIPVVRQLNAMECGAACLTMVLGYFGRHVRLESVRDAVGSNRDGTTAAQLVRIGEMFGLRGRGFKVDDPADLDLLAPGAILHWEFNHFVVFERLAKDGVYLVDPAAGRRFVAMAELRRSFTGVALQFEPSDAFQLQKKGRSLLLHYARATLRYTGLLPRLIAVTLILQLFVLATPMLTGAVVDQVLPRSDQQLLLVIEAGLLSFLAFHFLASFVRGRLFLHLRTHLDLKMTTGFLEHLTRLPYPFFQLRTAGDLLTRLDSNANIRDVLTSSALSAALDGSLVFLYLVVLCVVSPTFGLLVVVLAGCQIVSFLASRRRQRDLKSEGLQKQAKTRGYEIELLSGIETLKAMGREDRAVEQWTNLFVDETNTTVAAGRVDSFFEALNGTFAVANPLITLAVGATMVLDGRMTLGTMLAVNALANNFLVPVANLVKTAVQLNLVGTYVERLNDVLETAPEQSEARQPAPHLSGQIRVEDVSFRYGQLAPLVVENVSLRIEPGQFVALVGESAAGKSTLANLLLGLYQPSAGRILYDGDDLASLDLRGMRRQLGVVLQQAALFGSSIRDNITFSDRSIPLEQVIEAAKAAAIHDEIEAMALGYETPLLDGGRMLSGGQRQRLALARALLHRPSILLLDEATSALDVATERSVQAALASLRCTRIVVAHRLSTIVDADLILVMSHGRIVESGTHAELVAQGGAYAQLVGTHERQK